MASIIGREIVEEWLATDPPPGDRAGVEQALVQLTLPGGLPSAPVPGYVEPVVVSEVPGTNVWLTYVRLDEIPPGYVGLLFIDDPRVLAA